MTAVAKSIEITEDHRPRLEPGQPEGLPAGQSEVVYED